MRLNGVRERIMSFLEVRKVFLCVVTPVGHLGARFKRKKNSMPVNLLMSYTDTEIRHVDDQTPLNDK